MRPVDTRIVIATLVVAGACAPSEEHLRTRAAFDLKCSEDRLTVTDLGGYVRGVEGCGKRGTYVYVHKLGGWVLNANTQDAAMTGATKGAAIPASAR